MKKQITKTPTITPDPSNPNRLDRAETLRPRLCVMGSRTLEDERVKIILLEEINKTNCAAIITCAEPGGVSEVARKLAKEKGMPLILFHLNFKYLRGAFEHRSIDALRASDAAVFVHDGESKGTANELQVCKKIGVPYRYEKLEKSPYKESVGFPVADGEWAAIMQKALDDA